MHHNKQPYLLPNIQQNQYIPTEVSNCKLKILYVCTNAPCWSGNCLCTSCDQLFRGQAFAESLEFTKHTHAIQKNNSWYTHILSQYQVGLIDVYICKPRLNILGVMTVWRLKQTAPVPVLLYIVKCCALSMLLFPALVVLIAEIQTAFLKAFKSAISFHGLLLLILWLGPPNSLVNQCTGTTVNNLICLYFVLLKL